MPGGVSVRRLGDAVGGTALPRREMAAEGILASNDIENHDFLKHHSFMGCPILTFFFLPNLLVS